jgi:myo-inositol-1(or 4)-monophosphatase
MTQDLIHGIEALTAFAIEAIRSSGQAALDSFGKSRGATKFDEKLVTRAELQISKCFQQALDNQYPDHRMFTSKTLDTATPMTTGDTCGSSTPLTGLTITRRVFPYGACLWRCWKISGRCSGPSTCRPPGICFMPGPAAEAFWGEKRIRMTDDCTIDDESLMFTFSRFHQSLSSRFPGKIRNLGCTGAHLCYVAMGRADVVVTANESFQDLAAARMIIGGSRRAPV